MQVEFNKAAQSLTDALVPSAQKKTALTRLVKVSLVLGSSIFVFHTHSCDNSSVPVKSWIIFSG